MSESDPERKQSGPWEGIRALLDAWMASLGQLLEIMAGRKPEVSWRAATGPAGEVGLGPEAGVLWREEGFQFSSEAAVWVGAPRETWDHIAALMLKAAGLEAVPEAEAQKTWQELTAQWLSGLARAMAPILGQEVTCSGGKEDAPPANQQEWALVSLVFEARTLPPIAVAFSAPLLALLTQACASAPGPASGLPCISEASPPAAGSRTMELLLDVELPVSISFGRTELPLKDVLKLTTGSIVELNRGVDEPVEILVNHCLIARGEVVVIDGNYGVRIQKIISRQDRLRTLR